MEKKLVSCVMLTLLLIGMLTLAFNIVPVKAEPRTLTVDDDGPADFHTIQEAINNAMDGDTIYVYSGTYNESPRIFFTDNVTIIGESNTNTLVNGSISDGYCWYITYENLQVTGSIASGQADIDCTAHNKILNCVVHSGIGMSGSYTTVVNNTVEGHLYISGGYHMSPSRCVIENNTLLGSGIQMMSGGSHNLIIRNTIINATTGILAFDRGECYNFQYNNITENLFIQCEIGIKITWWPIGSEPVPSFSIISGNTFERNYYGIFFEQATRVSIYHNNFLNNTVSVYVGGSYNNFWDNGYPYGGNYQSDYVEKYPDAQELDDSGIWDTPYVIDANNTDRYPLMNPWTPSPPVVSATLDIDPNTLNLGSKGQCITAYIQLPEGYNAAHINATTLLLNGTISAVLDPKYGFVTNSSEYLVDYNNDGVLERMVKFDGVAVESFIISQGISCGNATLTITGKLHDGTQFEGTDIIFVFYGGAGGRRK